MCHCIGLPQPSLGSVRVFKCFAGQSKHPEQSLMFIVQFFFSERGPPTAAQLGPYPLSYLPQLASNTFYPQGLVAIPAGYLLSPSNHQLCNFWPSTSSLYEEEPCILILLWLSNHRWPFPCVFTDLKWNMSGWSLVMTFFHNEIDLKI